MAVKKPENSEGFIGKTFNNGNLEIIGVAERKHNNIMFKVICKICSPDKELFPEDYFTISKTHLLNGKLPCGCSTAPRWDESKWLVRARRAVENKTFIILGLAESFKGYLTNVSCKCKIDGHTWTLSLDNITRGISGCPVCSKKYRPTEEEALDKCIVICKEMNYDPIGFLAGYTNANKTIFEYVCPHHGLQRVRYSSFIHKGSRCWDCAKDVGNGRGYYPKRAEEQDYLYVMNFDDKYIKVGRSFDVYTRVGQLQWESGCSNIRTDHVYTATHKEVYNCEQKLHSILRDHGLQYNTTWSTETFHNHSGHVLNELLPFCGLDKFY